MGAEVLSPRALNRALLARQLLLSRVELPAIEAVEHLVGLQAQVPANPYTALWSRLDGFQADELSRALEERRVVRISVMRATIHLVSAADCLVLRPLTQPVLHAELARHPQFGPVLRGVDLAPVLEAARRLLDERPLSLAQLRAALGERFPGMRRGRPRVRVPLQARARAGSAAGPVGPVGAGGVRARRSRGSAGHLRSGPSLDDVVLRYLRAFGPATAADVATWSRLTGLAAVLERLRPRLVTFRDERGRELFDLPDAPRPDEWFLRRCGSCRSTTTCFSRTPTGAGSCRRASARGLRAGSRASTTASVLVDGFLAGMWRPEGKELVVRLGVRLSKRSAASVAAEGRRLLRFLGDQTDAEHVRLAGPD